MTPAARLVSWGGRTSSPPQPTLIEFRRILLVRRRRLPTRSRSPLHVPCGDACTGRCDAVRPQFQGACRLSRRTSESGHGRGLGVALPEHWLPGGAGGEVPQSRGPLRAGAAQGSAFEEIVDAQRMSRGAGLRVAALRSAPGRARGHLTAGTYWDLRGPRPGGPGSTGGKARRGQLAPTWPTGGEGQGNAAPAVWTLTPILSLGRTGEGRGGSAVRPVTLAVPPCLPTGCRP
jgi:hypothetical protein